MDSLRQTYKDNLILLENGDILQGQPTCYYYNYIATKERNVAADVVNYLKYDAQTFGNHDVETGHAVYDKWIKELNCPVIGANIIDTKTQAPYVKPYIILNREGVKIAVLGMITPAIPNWLAENLWSGLRFENMLTSAKYWMKQLQEKEDPDVVIGLFHSGWDGGIKTEEYEEDAAQKVAQEVQQVRQERGTREEAVWIVHYYPETDPVGIIEFLLKPTEEEIQAYQAEQAAAAQSDAPTESEASSAEQAP